MIKYNIYISTTDTHQQPQKLSEKLIQVYNKGKNDILDLTFDPSYMWLYAFLPPVYNSECLDEDANGDCYYFEVYFQTLPKLI